MTTGQIVFMAGAALLAVTVILGIVFLIKKPKYNPESAAFGGGNGATQQLRNGYPTDPLTVHRDAPQRAGALETKTLPTSGAAQTPGTATLRTGPAGQETAALNATEALVTGPSESTEALTAALTATPAPDLTVPLGGTGTVNLTEPLNRSEKPDQK